MNHRLLPILREVLGAIREQRRIEEVVGLILEQACALASAAHGSFILVDHESRHLTIANVFGSDWTLEKRLCQLEIGQGLTGKVAASGRPMLCRDTATDPDYYPLFDYVRSELVVPVLVKDRVWGVINIDGLAPDAFDSTTVELLVVFGELVAFAINLRLEIAEQDKLHRQLLQSEKLASLGEALAGIAHEINNPLTAILCSAALLETEHVSAAQRATLATITSEAERAAALIRSLLEFSRKETGRREIVDLHQLVDQVAELKRHQLKFARVLLLVSRDQAPCPVHVCPQQIKQVLLGLITNAEQALAGFRPDGLVHITVRPLADRVQVCVADNGPGIPAAAQRSIFDPFFTTKPPGEGTGLGLSVAHSIVEAHGGRIQLLDSSPAGATFELQLPLVPAGALPAPAPATPLDRPPASLAGRILLVDDEPHIVESLAAYLRLLRIDVLTASDGPGALQVLRAGNVDLVLTDIRMPGMDGLALHEAASRLDPHYSRRFVFMSGYLLHPDLKSRLAATALPCLEKPFSLDELRRLLEPLLARPQPIAAVS